MIYIYTRPTCAYCPMVKKYFDMRDVKYKVVDVESHNTSPEQLEEYVKLANKFGYSVPLVLNKNTGDGMCGFDIARLKKLAGI